MQGKAFLPPRGRGGPARSCEQPWRCTHPPTCKCSCASQQQQAVSCNCRPLLSVAPAPPLPPRPAPGLTGPTAEARWGLRGRGLTAARRAAAHPPEPGRAGQAPPPAAPTAAPTARRAQGAGHADVDDGWLGCMAQQQQHCRMRRVHMYCCCCFACRRRPPPPNVLAGRALRRVVPSASSPKGDEAPKRLCLFWVRTWAAASSVPGRQR